MPQGQQDKPKIHAIHVLYLFFFNENNDIHKENLLGKQD